MSFQIDWAIGV